MARTKDGWIKMYSNLVLKGLDGDEIAYYTIANLIADPKDSPTPGKFDISDRAMALLLEWSHHRAGDTRKSLIRRGFIIDNGDGSYTINGYAVIQSRDFTPAEELSENRFPLEEILAFKRQRRRFLQGLKPRGSRAKVGRLFPLDSSGSSHPTVGAVIPLLGGVVPVPPASGRSRPTRMSGFDPKEDYREGKKGKKKAPEHSLTEGQKYWLTQFEMKRFPTFKQKDAVAALESEVGIQKLKQAIDWGARNNIRRFDSIATAARRKEIKGGFREPGRHPEEDRHHPAYRGFSIIESHPEPEDDKDRKSSVSGMRPDLPCGDP